MNRAISEYRFYGRRGLRGRWGTAIAAALIIGVVTSAISFVVDLIIPIGGGATFFSQLESVINGNLTINPEQLIPVFSGVSILAVISSLITSMVSAALSLGQKAFYIQMHMENRAELGTLFSRFRIWFKAFGLELFISLFVFLWSLLFIIPGIIATYRYAMAYHIMAENPDLGIRECVNRSKILMRGNKGRYFLLELSFIGWAFLCMFTFGIGFLWLTPYMLSSQTAFFLDLTQRLPERGMYTQYQ